MEKVRLASGVSLSTAPRLLLVIGTLDPAHTVNPVLFTILGIASLTGVMMNLRLAGMLVLSLSGQSSPTVLATSINLSSRLSDPS